MSLAVQIVANESELKEVCKFRYSVYVEELKRENFGYVSSVEKLLQDPLDDLESCTNLFVRNEEGDVVGCMRVHAPLPPEYVKCLKVEEKSIFGELNEAKFFGFGSRFMVRPDFRGRDYHVGPDLMAHMWATCRNRGAQFIVGNCTPSLLTMYERKGWSRYANAYYDKIGRGLQTPIILALGCLGIYQKIDKHTPFGTIGDGDDDTDPALEPGRKWFLEHLESHDNVEINSQLIDQAQLMRYLEARVPMFKGNKVRFFKHLEPEEVVKYFQSAGASVVSVPAGDFVVRTADIRDEMFLVLSGKLHKDGGSHFLVRGDVIGEESFLSGRKRVSNIQVIDRCELLVLSRMGLLKALKLAPAETSKLLMQVGKDVSREYAQFREILCAKIDAASRVRWHPDSDEVKALVTLAHHSRDVGDDAELLEPDEATVAQHMGWQRLRRRVSSVALLSKLMKAKDKMEAPAPATVSATDLAIVDATVVDDEGEEEEEVESSASGCGGVSFGVGESDFRVS